MNRVRLTLERTAAVRDNLRALGVTLAPQPLFLLTILASANGRTLTHGQLCDALRDLTGGDADRATLTTSAKLCRRAFEACDFPVKIISERSLGYRLETEMLDQILKGPEHGKD